VKLHASGDNSREQNKRGGGRQNQGRRFGRLLEDLEKDIGYIRPHGFRAVQDEDPTPAHRLEVGRSLDSAQLSDTKHWAHHRVFQPDRVWKESPNIGVALDDERCPFHGSRVGTFPALCKTLCQQLLRAGELGDLPAWSAFATKVIEKPFAVGGLRKQARESELPDAARPGEKKSVWNPRIAKRASQRGNNFFITQKLGKTHGSTFTHCIQNSVHGGEHFRSDIFGEPQRIVGGIVALDGSPRLAAREHVIHFGGVFQVLQAFLLNVVRPACVVSLGLSRDQSLSLARGDPQINDQVFPRQPVDGILEMFDPTKEFRTFLG